MLSKVKQAIILAGGKGERLRPLTNDRPKAMVEIMGHPIMSYALGWLKKFGVEHVAVSCGYQYEVMQKFFGDGSTFDLKLDYLVEDKPLGRGGGMKNAMRFLCPDRPVLAFNGDMITSLSIEELYDFHVESRPYATVVTTPLKSPYGIVDINSENSITGFREKPELPFWINAGIYILDPKIVDLLPDVGEHEEQTFPQLASSGGLKAFKSRYFWRTVDTMKDLTELKSELNKLSEELPLSLIHP